MRTTKTLMTTWTAKDQKSPLNRFSPKLPILSIIHSLSSSSQTTGTRQKKEKRSKNVLQRNVKEGSPIEEDYLIEYMLEIQKLSEALISNFAFFYRNTKKPKEKFFCIKNAVLDLLARSTLIFLNILYDSHCYFVKYSLFSILFYQNQPF